MRGSNAGNVKRITAGIMGMMMLVIVLFSAFCIAAEADHECCGEDCPVCACVRQFVNTLRRIGTGVAVRSAPFVSAVLFLTVSFFAVTTAVRNTPVSQNVRLNN